MKTILYLSRADVECLGLDIPFILDLLEDAFREKAAGRVESPPKPGIHTRPEAFSNAMLAYIPQMKAAGVKWISAYSENPNKGLPYISGLMVLSDVDTGVPYAVMDCTWVTAYRTAGASALAAKYLARPESETAAIVSCGVQGRTHLQALAAVFPLKKAYAYDIRPDIQKRFTEEMSAVLKLDVLEARDPQQAVSEADLVVTSGPILRNPAPAIRKDWLKAGAFASAVDYDSYWAPEALAQIDKLCTDDLSQFKYYREAGFFQGMALPYAELSEIIAGRKPGRERPEERTMAMNLGLALEDIALGAAVYRAAREKGIGTILSL